MSHLVWFINRADYANLRFQELSALLQLPSTCSASSPDAFLRLDLDTAAAAALVRKGVLVRAVVELWAEADSCEALLPLVQKTGKIAEHITASGSSFCFEVSSYGRKLATAEQRRLMNLFAPLFRGDEPADMRQPACVLCVLEFPNAQTDGQSRWFFGRQIAPVGRLVLQPEHERMRLALSQRPVLGPTTLDNDLAFIMANVAEIGRGSLVLDPFCGTAGLLLTAAARGAFVVGGELDARVVHGWQCTYSKGGQERTDVRLNFEHYEFSRPELVICDNAKRPWRANHRVFDAVVTDLPYGVRAATKCTGERQRLVQYADEALLKDLLDTASTSLRDGGVVVFLMHVELIDLFEEAELPGSESKKIFVRNRPADNRRTLYCPESCRLPPLLDLARYERLIPRRANFRLESAGLQILTAGTGRLLVKMRRLADGAPL